VTHDWREYSYTVLLEPDAESGTWTVTVPALPGVVTQGDSVDGAIVQARDAIRLHIEGLIADGEQVPEERERPQLATVQVAA
jgi:antitoxin HicB